MPSGDILGQTVSAELPIVVYGKRAGLVSAHASPAAARAALALEHSKPSARCDPTDARVYVWDGEQWTPAALR